MPRLPLSMLGRKALRDAWHLRGPSLAIAMVVLAGVASFVSMRSMVPHLRDAQARYYERARFADVWVSVRRAPAAVAAELTRIPGVAAVEVRATDDVIVQVPGLEEPAAARVIGLTATRALRVNTLVLRKGRLLAAGQSDEVVVSEGFATANQLAPGDSLSVVLGGRWRRLHIVGIALSPEFVLEMRAGELFPDNRRYGVLWIDAPSAAAAFGLQGAWNDATLRLAPGASERDVIARLDVLLARYGSLGAHGRAEQMSHRFLTDEIQQASVFATSTPLIFLGVAAFLVHLVLGRLVASQREQIGMMKAFGMPTRTLALHYAMIASVPVAIGTLGGTAVGLWFAGRIAALYARYYRIPDAPFTIKPDVVLLAVGITSVAALAGAIGAVRRVTQLPAAEAMRPETPARYRAGIVERLRLTRVVGPVGRLTLRGLERRPARAALAMLGMALSVAVVIVGGYAFDAIVALRDVHFTAAQREDVAVTFAQTRGMAALYELRRLAGVLRLEPTMSVPVLARHERFARRIVVTGAADTHELRRVVDRDGRAVRIPPRGVLLSAALAELLHVRTGDSLDLDALTGERAHVRVAVSAIVDDLIGTGAWMDVTALRTTFRETAYDGAVLSVDPRAIESVRAVLLHRPAVAGIGTRQAVIANFDRVMRESFGVTITALGIFAVILAIGVLYNTARIALSERARELASLRVLGFTRAEVARLLFGELALLGVLAIPLGFTIGVLFCWMLGTALSSELFRLPLVVAPRTFGWAVLVLVMSGGAAALIVRRRLDALHLVKALKTRE